MTMTLPSITLNMNRRTMSDLLGLDRGRIKLLDDININYNTRFENLGEISDTAISAMNFEQLKIENGLKHNVTVTSSRNFGFLTVSPTLKYNEFTGFNQLIYSTILKQTRFKKELTQEFMEQEITAHLLA